MLIELFLYVQVGLLLKVSRIVGTGVRFPAGAGNFSLCHRIQTGSEAHPNSYPTEKGDTFPDVSGTDLKLTTQIHLAPRLKMSGAITPTPPYIFMVWFLVTHNNSFPFTLTVMKIM
jgi:hypothetical protein